MKNRTEDSKANNQFVSIIDRLPLGVFIVQNSELAYVNDAFTDIFGIDNDKPGGQKELFDLILQEDIIKIRSEFQNILSSEAKEARFSVRAHNRDGKPVICEITGRKDLFMGEAAIVCTVTDITATKSSADRIDHLLAILRSAREVSKLMLHDKEIDSLIQGVCDALIRTHACMKSWIILTDNSLNILNSASAGLGSDFIRIIESFKSNNIPLCCRRSMERPGLTIINDPFIECEECNLSDIGRNMGVIAYNLEYRDIMFGFFHVTIPLEYINDIEVRLLIEDLAIDLSFALYTSQLERKHKEALRKLKRSDGLEDNTLAGKESSLEGDISSSYDWKDKLILIVEDSKVNYQLFMEILKKTRAQILWVTRGSEAVEIVRDTENIDLVLMDMKLPDISGGEAAKQTRIFNRDIPIIAISSFKRDEMEEDALKSGCNSFLSRPMENQLFLKEIGKWFN